MVFKINHKNMKDKIKHIVISAVGAVLVGIFMNLWMTSAGVKFHPLCMIATIMGGATAGVEFACDYYEEDEMWCVAIGALLGSVGFYIWTLL